MDLIEAEELVDWALAKRARQLIFSYKNADDEFGKYLIKPLSIKPFYNSDTLMLNCIYRFGEKEHKVKKKYPPRNWSEPLVLNFSIKRIIKMAKVGWWFWGFAQTPEPTFHKNKDKV